MELNDKLSNLVGLPKGCAMFQRHNLKSLQECDTLLKTDDSDCAGRSRNRTSFLHAIAVVLLLWLSAHVRPINCASFTNDTARKKIESSELSFEYLGLRSLPIARELCTIEAQNLNAVSFANNRIERIDGAAFACISSRLKILNLSNNKIATISPVAFTELHQLQVLLLDGNQLATVPSVALQPLVTLRHLNLASNQIERISLNANSSQPLAGAHNDNEAAPAQMSNNEPLALPHLISLNLRSNPLHWLDRRAFGQLPQLKTLTLSQTNLSNWSDFWPASGLSELRFLHLDRAVQSVAAKPSNSTALDEFDCSRAPNLLAISLRANELRRVPKFAPNCKTLQSLDLSYNQIGGQLGGGQLAHLSGLLDLRLGHNALEQLNERALLGLNRLQSLDLQANRLESVHVRALAHAPRLVELNVAQNERLSELALPEENQLETLWAYANPALRRLPRLAHAKRLSLTYAYHCCDYYPPTTSPTATQARTFLVQEAHGDEDYEREEDADEEEEEEEEANGEWLHTDGRFGMHHGGGDGEQPLRGSLLAQLADAIFAKFSGHQQAEHKSRNNTNDWQRSNGNQLELAELVVWPSAAAASGGAGKHTLRTTHYARHNKRERARNNSGRPFADGDHSKVKRATVIDGLAGSARASKSGSARNYIRLYHRQLKQLQQQQQRWRQQPRRRQQRRRRRRRAETDDERERRNHQGRPVVSSGGATDEGDDDDYEPGARVARWTRVSARPKAPVCVPRPNAFMPCQDLFDSWWLRAGVWLVFCCSFVGNLLVIIVLGSARPSSSSSALANLMWLSGHSKRHIDVPRFLVLNLAFADLLMALYLGLLAFADLSTLGEFKLHAIQWQRSLGCKLAAFLAVLSSELSVFILAIITLERNYAITNAVHLNRRLSLQKAMLIMLFGYAFALGMALAPLQGVSDYRKFSVCLPLDFETNAWSSAYIITLLSINSASFLLLLSCYLRMYCAIRGSQAWNTNDLKIAKRMSVLIFTDFLCWMPIILVACFALAGHHLVGPRGLKVLTIFVLPLNSVANPFLYAITTKKFKRDLLTLKRRLARFANASKQRQQPQQQQQQLQQHQQQQQQLQGNALQKSTQIRQNHHTHSARSGQNAQRKHRMHCCEWSRACTPENGGVRQEAEADLITPAAALAAAQKSLRSHRGGKRSKNNWSEVAPIQRRHDLGSDRSKSALRACSPAAQTLVLAREPDDQRQARPARCSCGRPLNVAAAGAAVDKHQVAVQVRLSGASLTSAASGLHGRRTPPSCRSAEPADHGPRIVLDSVCEPMLDIALAPLNLLASGGGGGCSNSATQLGARSSGRHAAAAVPAPAQTNEERLLRPSSAELAIAACAPRRTSQSATGPVWLEAADELAAVRPAKHLASCQAILWRSEEGHCKHSVERGENKSQSNNSARSQLSEREQEERCASACASQWPVSGQKITGAANIEPQRAGSYNMDSMRAQKSLSPGARVHLHHKCAHCARVAMQASEIGVACTCGGGGGATTTTSHQGADLDHQAHKANTNDGNNKLSRSISRLLFGPIARAWSSIQSVSLHSVVAAASPAAHQHRAQRFETTTSCSASSSPGNQKARGPTMCKCKRRANENQSNILEDILSSPARRRDCTSNGNDPGAHQQRRMSRSCDQITTNTNITLLFGPDQSTTSATGDSRLVSAQTAHPQQECTTTASLTSQSMGDDDRRLLLATISRLAGSSPSGEVCGRSEQL